MSDNFSPSEEVKVIDLGDGLTIVAEPNKDRHNNWAGRDFTGKKTFIGRDLSWGNYSGCTFTGCDLAEANFSGANLTHAILPDDLTRTYLARANLTGTRAGPDPFIEVAGGPYPLANLMLDLIPIVKERLPNGLTLGLFTRMALPSDPDPHTLPQGWSWIKWTVSCRGGAAYGLTKVNVRRRVAQEI